MILIAESDDERDFLYRRLAAILHTFGPSITIRTPNLLSTNSDPVLSLDRKIRTSLLHAKQGL